MGEQNQGDGLYIVGRKNEEKRKKDGFLNLLSFSRNIEIFKYIRNNFKHFVVYGQGTQFN